MTSRSGAILKTTVVREKWELNNDDIELVISDKIKNDQNSARFGKNKGTTLVSI